PGPPAPGTTVTTGSVAGGQASSDILTYSYNQTIARPALTARVGVNAENWTFFGKAGLGVSIYNQTTVTDETASVYCDATATQTTLSGNTAYTQDTGCIGPKPGSVNSTNASYVTPNVIF